MKRKEYLSPDIVNEMIVMMGQCVLRHIIAQIKSALWFALIANEANHISHNKQNLMCTSVHCVNTIMKSMKTCLDLSNYQMLKLKLCLEYSRMH